MTIHLRSAKFGSKGLELGAIEMLLKKIVSIDGPDAPLKRNLHDALSRNLSETGVTAFKTGDLVKLVDGSDREQFRNPAAHARYVDLATAKRSKQHVESALKLLTAYTKATTAAVSTIH